MENLKSDFEDQSSEMLSSATEIKSANSDSTENVVMKDANELKYFECILCGLREKYDYFGRLPPYQKCFMLPEDSYIIEDPFIPPKQGEFLILGSHCVTCRKMVCKDPNCSIYYNGTLCIDCAKSKRHEFPKVVQDKLNRIVK